MVNLAFVGLVYVSLLVPVQNFENGLFPIIEALPNLHLRKSDIHQTELIHSKCFSSAKLDPSIQQKQ